MRIERLVLKNYRNYKDESMEFSDGLNVIVGDNAQGKTNAVEAVMLCCIGRSPRTAKDKELINFGAEAGYIRAQVIRSIGRTKVELYITKSENKRIKINELPISKMGELMGNINAVYFSPDELSLIKEAPENRRKFLDTDISQIKKSYFYMLKRYNKILTQRNNLLKNYLPKTTMETIDIWDGQLATEGAGIICERAAFCERLKEYVKSCHAFITDGREKIEIEYAASVKCDLSKRADVEQYLLNKLRGAVEKDIRLGFTSAGPHRDDIKVEVNGIDIRSYGSQGQQRTAALSMKLAELKLFKDITGEYPVLLLDDVLSELDEGRQRKLIELTRGIQTVITATRADKNVLPDNINVIEIREGKVVKDF